MFRLLYAIPSYLIFTIFRTFMILLGWIVVPIAAAFGAYEPYTGKDGVGNQRTDYRFTWKIMYPWGNREDGIANDTYVKFDSMFMKIVYWSCFRNPANNLRYVPFLSVEIDPNKVRWVGGPHELPASYDMKPAEAEWFFCWCGFYSNFWWQFRMDDSIWRAWIGWKIFPVDIYGVTGHRKESAGFATQFKRLK